MFHIDLDTLFWTFNWTESTDGEFFPQGEQAVTHEDWISDGDYPQIQHTC